MESNEITNIWERKKFFLISFLHIWNLDEMLNIFKQKMSFIPDAIPKLRSPKDIVR